MKFLTDGKRHLICVPFSVQNLHLMAKELDIGKHWFHGGKIPHYDIPKKRKLEIESKCELVSSRVILKIVNEHQNQTKETSS